MQVFLPESTFSKCAEVLDTKRLVKQLLEGRQILTVLAGESTSKGWKNHPAVKMFEGYEVTLVAYLAAIRDEMDCRGYKWEKNWAVIQDIYDRHYRGVPQPWPYWMRDEQTWNKVMATHRGRLWEKDKWHYHMYASEGDTYKSSVCCDRCNYYWPTHKMPLMEVFARADGIR